MRWFRDTLVQQPAKRNETTETTNSSSPTRQNADSEEPIKKVFMTGLMEEQLDVPNLPEARVEYEKNIEKELLVDSKDDTENDTEDGDYELEREITSFLDGYNQSVSPFGQKDNLLLDDSCVDSVQTLSGSFNQGPHPQLQLSMLDLMDLDNKIYGILQSLANGKQPSGHEQMILLELESAIVDTSEYDLLKDKCGKLSTELASEIDSNIKIYQAYYRLALRYRQVKLGSKSLKSTIANDNNRANDSVTNLDPTAIQKLEQENKLLQTQHEQHEKEIGALNKKLKDSVADFDNLKNNYGEIRKAQQDLEKQREILRQQNQELQSSMKTQIQNLEIKIEETQRENADLKQQKAVVVEENGRLKQQIDQLTKETNKRGDNEIEILELQSKIKELSKQVKAIKLFEASQEESQKLIVSLRDSISNLQGSKEYISKESEKLKIDNRNLKTKLANKEMSAIQNTEHYIEKEKQLLLEIARLKNAHSIASEIYQAKQTYRFGYNSHTPNDASISSSSRSSSLLSNFNDSPLEKTHSHTNSVSSLPKSASVKSLSRRNLAIEPIAESKESVTDLPIINEPNPILTHIESSHNFGHNNVIPIASSENLLLDEQEFESNDDNDGDVPSANENTFGYRASNNFLPKRSNSFRLAASAPVNQLRRKSVTLPPVSKSASFSGRHGLASSNSVPSNIPQSQQQSLYPSVLHPSSSQIPIPTLPSQFPTHQLLSRFPISQPKAQSASIISTSTPKLVSETETETEDDGDSPTYNGFTADRSPRWVLKPRIDVKTNFFQNKHLKQHRRARSLMAPSTFSKLWGGNNPNGNINENANNKVNGNGLVKSGSVNGAVGFPGTSHTSNVFLDNESVDEIVGSTKEAFGGLSNGNGLYQRKFHSVNNFKKYN